MHTLVLVLSCMILGAYAHGYGYSPAPKEEKEEQRGYGYAPVPKKPEPRGYRYSGHEKVDPATPYEMNYDITDDYGNQRWRKESGDAYNNKEGSYGYQDSYGLYRKVRYWADESGFHVYVDTNEPGVGDDNPADAEFTVNEAPKNAYGDHGKRSGYGYESSGYGHGKVIIKKEEITSGYGGDSHGSGYGKVTTKKDTSSGYGHDRKQGYGHRNGYGKTIKVVKVVKVEKKAPVYESGYGKENKQFGYGQQTGHGKSSAYVHQQRHGDTPFEYTSVW